MDVHQSPAFAKFMEGIDWQVEKVGHTNIFIRHFPFPILSRWSVIKVQRFKTIDLKQLDKVAKKHHALLSKLEPISESKLNLVKDNWPLLPTKTIIIDLNKQLPSNTKNKINRASKLGLITKRSKDIDLFIRLWQRNAEEKKFWVGSLNRDIQSMYKAFGKNSFIFITYKNNRPLSGILITGFEKTAHYFYAFSTTEGRNNWAAYHCLAEAIKFLITSGYRYLDFQGVYNERYPKLRTDWKGFTEFKRRWNGKEVYYPLGFTKFYNPIISLTFKLFSNN